METKKPTILYVDDDEFSRRLFKEIFDKEYKILMANDGREGLAKLQEHNGDINLIISDLRMPHLSGIEFLQATLEIDETPQRILLTAYGEATELKEAINNCKISNFVQKPWTPEELSVTIKQCLSKYFLLKKNQELTASLKAKSVLLEEELHHKSKLFKELEKSKSDILKSERKYKDFIQYSQEGIFLLSIQPGMPITLKLDEQINWLLSNALIEECNNAFARMYGYESYTELTGKFLNVIWAKHNKEIQEVLEIFIQNEYSFPSIETFEMIQNGEKKWFLNTGRGMIENKHLISIWGTQIDITEKKKAEENLIKSQEKYRVIAENTNDVIWTMNAKGEFLYISPSINKLSGYTPEEILKIGFKKTFTPNSAKKVNKFLLRYSKLLKEGRVHKEPEFHFLEQTVKNGGSAWTEVTISKIFDSKSNFLFFLGVSRDISERIKAEEMLQISEEKFSRMFNLSPDAIILEGLENGEIVNANVKAGEVLEYNKKELYNNTTTDLKIWNFPEDRVSLVLELKKKDFVSNLETIIRAKSGVLKTCLISASRIDLSSGSFILEIIRDISERKRIENALKESEELFKAIIEQTEEGILLVENDFEVKLFNDSLSLMTNYSTLELESINIFNLFDKYSRDAIKTGVATSNSIQREVTIIKKDKSKFFAEIKGNPVSISSQKLYLFIISNITERYLAGKAIQKSEAKLKEAQKTAHIGNWSYHVPHEKLEWSEEVYNIYGLSKKSYIPDSENIRAFIHQSDRESVLKDYQEAAKSKSRFDFSYRIINANKKIRHIKQMGRIVRDGDGSPIQFIGVIQDITELKIAEEKVKKLNIELEGKVKKRTAEYQTSEKKFRDLLQFVPDGIAVVNKNKQIILANKQLNTMLGYKENELINKQLSLVIPEDSIIEKKYAASNFHQKPSRKIYELSACRKDGVKIPIEFSLGAVNIDKEIHLICIMRNIAQRKENEALLRKITQALEQSPSVVVITDTKGDIEYVNPSFTRVSLYSKKEVLGKNPRLLKHQGKHSIDYANIWKTITRGQKWEGDLPNQRKNGEFYWSRAVISPILNSDGGIMNYVSIQNDITKIKEAEEELRLAKQAAELANNAKSTFLANISHEIRTPLNSVLGMSELLNQQINNPTHKSYLGAINSSGKTLLSLINDVLDLSKIESGKIELRYSYFSPRQTLREIFDTLAFKADEKKIKFELEVSPLIPDLIYLDELRFRQILLNILNNAVKFTLNGSVKIALSSDEKACSENKTNIQITVEDTGIGIAKDFLDQLFTPFAQQEGQDTRRFEGTGLGLAISGRLIELMKGQIKVESTQNVGSTFTILYKDIKCSKQKSKKVSAVNQIDWSVFKESCVLIVDDIESNRVVLSALLKKTKLKVELAIDGENALEVLNKVTPDLIITDLLMPNMDGHEFISRLKSDKRYRNIPIIAISATIQAQHRKQLIDAGVVDLITKPIQSKILFKLMAKHLATAEDEKLTNSGHVENNMINYENNSELKRILTTDILKQWKELENRQPINLVRKFADSLSKLADTYNLKDLKVYSDNINNAIEAYDVDQMLKLLSEYPNLIGLEN